MFSSIETLISNFEHVVSTFLESNQNLPVPLLVILAFGGGLAASLTPCCLAMLPLTLSYIGTAKIASKIDAFKKVSLFVLGAALIFTLLGLFASFASFITIEFRGYVNIAIGLFILVMALTVLEVIKIPLPQFVTNIPHGGPFIVGVFFALVSSPCASPILFAVLAMSGVSGLVGSIFIMFAYSIGYTGVIFITSVFAGIAKQLDFFKRHSRIVNVVSCIILGLLGIYYLYSGIKWFVG